MKLLRLLSASLFAVLLHPSADAKDWLAFPLGLNYDLALETTGAHTARIAAKYVDGLTPVPATLDARVFDVSSKEGHAIALAKLKFRLSEAEFPL